MTNGNIVPPAEQSVDEVSSIWNYLEWFWLIYVLPMLYIFKRIFGQETRLQLLEQAKEDAEKRRDEEREMTTSWRQEITKKLETHNGDVLTEIRAVKTEVTEHISSVSAHAKDAHKRIDKVMERRAEK